MKSSYLNNDLNYGDVISASIFGINPKKIVEFGILDGFSLKVFAHQFPNADIEAFDIFDEFNGNHPQQTIFDRFSEYKNVKISYGDFYKKHEELGEIDILHVDIANNGDVVKYCIDKYLPKLSKNGILLIEGGSEERDQIGWMVKYNKPLINPVIKELSQRSDLNVIVLGKMPSITLISKKL